MNYNLAHFLKAILEETPDMPLEEAKTKASQLRREYHRADSYWVRNQQRQRRYYLAANGGEDDNGAEDSQD